MVVECKEIRGLVEHFPVVQLLPRRCRIDRNRALVFIFGLVEFRAVETDDPAVSVVQVVEIDLVFRILDEFWTSGFC